MIKTVSTSLLITRNKGFWTTDISRSLFEKSILMSERAGFVEQVIVAIKGLWNIFREKPTLVFIGTSNKIVTIYAFLRRFGLLKKISIVTDKQYLKKEVLERLDGAIVYSPDEIGQYDQSLKHKLSFLLFPSKNELLNGSKIVSRIDGEYILSSGNNCRDYKSLIEATKDLDIKLVLVTDSVKREELNSNCILYPFIPLDEFMSLFEGALFVVVPLMKSEKPHGHYVISSALSVGKPVITTRDASVDSYIEENKDGLLVMPGDIKGYRDSIKKLLNDRSLLKNLTENAKKSAPKFSYEAYANNIYDFCEKVRSRKIS